MSLRAKILIPFLLGSLALTVFLSSYIHDSAQRAAGESIHLTAKAQTDNVLHSMSLLFRSMETAVEKMALDPHVINTLVPGSMRNAEIAVSTGSWLELLEHGNEYYRGIFIIDKHGKCVASNSPMQVGAYYTAKPYAIAALAGKTTISDAAVGMLSKNLTATAASPVYINGESVGAIVLVNEFPGIVDYGKAETEKDGLAIFAALLTPNGSFAIHKNMEIMEQGGAFKELYTQFSALRNGDNVEYFLNGKKYHGYAMLEPTTEWVVISGGLDSEVFRFARDIGSVVFAVSFFALCLISFVVVQVVNNILNSLFALIEYAKKVAEGDLTLTSAGSKRSDELGVLRDALQTMVGSMQSMIVRSQEASRMKSEFLANMSHEIRTPLNAVIGMAYLYLADNSPADDASAQKKRDYVVKIQIAAKSLLGIINNVLDISKIEAGMFDLDKTPFNLREAVGQMVVIHHDNAAAKGLEFSVDYAPGLPESFIGDPTRVGQVLNNLTGNALKFTEKGSVCIHCALVAPMDTEGRLCVGITVSDTGLGIPQEKLDTIFKPFTQADASITRRFGGTGLGLAISDKIVQMMGGAFTVQSRPGTGTDFSFTMLLAPYEEKITAQSETDTAEAFRQLRLEGKRILVAEDNAINQLVMEELLSPTGAEIIMAGNGRIAVEAVKEHEFALVFMDMQMPEMDGIQASHEIRKFASYDILPIVAVTANAMKEEKEQGFAAGLNDYITKPVDPQQLISALRRWVR